MGLRSVFLRNSESDIRAPALAAQPPTPIGPLQRGGPCMPPELLVCDMWSDVW